MIFVFAALLEYAVVQWISRQNQEGIFYQKKVAEMRQKLDVNSGYKTQFDNIRSCFRRSWLSILPCVDDILGLSDEFSLWKRESLHLAYLDHHLSFEFDPDEMKGAQFYYEFATLVDKRSQIIFPSAFVFFMTIYWGVLFWVADQADEVLADAIPYSPDSV